MKKPVFFILLLAVSCNIMVFLYGLAAFMSSKGYEKSRQESYALDSALCLAVLAREDNALMPRLEHNFVFSGRECGYDIKKLDTGGDYIRVYFKKNQQVIFREYIRP